MIDLSLSLHVDTHNVAKTHSTVPIVNANMAPNMSHYLTHPAELWAMLQ